MKSIDEMAHFADPEFILADVDGGSRQVLDLPAEGLLGAGAPRPFASLGAAVAALRRSTSPGGEVVEPILLSVGGSNSRRRAVKISRRC